MVHECQGIRLGENLPQVTKQDYLYCETMNEWKAAMVIVDKNFAIHFPWIDRLFGTYYYPDEWPKSYGLDDEEIAPGFIMQTIEPFTKRKRMP